MEFLEWALIEVPHLVALASVLGCFGLAILTDKS